LLHVGSKHAMGNLGNQGFPPSKERTLDLSWVFRADSYTL